MKEQRKIMREEIRHRLEDSAWDLKIAGAVVQKKHLRRFRVISGLSLSSMAAAASLVIIMNAVFNGTDRSPRYNSFISEQIHGTYRSVFTSAAAAAENHSPDDDMLSVQAIDSVIDEALALR